MGKASSGKKVARAASTGGGRTSRGKTPWGWYSAISLVVVLGIVLVAFSRDQSRDRLGAASEEHPTQQEHLHAAYGFYFCDQFMPPLADNGKDPLGIHTHGDGIVHVHPFSRAASGKRAVFDVFSRTMNITVTSSRLEVADKKFSNGDKCGDKPGEVRVLVNGKEIEGDPGDIHFEDRQAIVIAFAPKDATIPEQPPSFAGLNNLSDVPGGGGAPPTGVPNDATTSSTAPGDTPPPSETPPTEAPPTSAAEPTTSSSTP
jgi:hypothetical protein